ncbi:hypothetical protein VPNG_02262 [Cytospora leucostoma]|uniref:Oxidoreductase n=1 Tax=Cytospora leucostoma TaxID=1230097 RepID=A0A423XGF5_9PEZI|nr:hypothetical protein VPNG_02262 [Cytospora leucostoma]
MPVDNSRNFDPERDVPLLTGKVIFITGGTAGLGARTLEQLAKKKPSHIYFTGRSTKGAEAIISKIEGFVPRTNITFVQLDQADLASIKRALEKDFKHDRLDVLICNAGIMATPAGTSKDGYEIQFAINHLGHALIIKKLLPTLLRTAALPGADVRVISITSLGWKGHPAGGIQFETLRSAQDMGFAGPWKRYGQSKLANIIYPAELARRHPRVTALSVHPGVAETELVNTQPFLHKVAIYVGNLGRLDSPGDATLNTLWAAAAAPKSELQNGAWYLPVGVLAQSQLDKDASDPELAKKLWDYTEDALKDF